MDWQQHHARNVEHWLERMVAEQERTARSVEQVRRLLLALTVLALLAVLVSAAGAAT